MDFIETIQNIRQNIISLNSQINGQIEEINRVEKHHNLNYFEKQQLSLLKRSDTHKLNKLKKGQLTIEDMNNSFTSDQMSYEQFNHLIEQDISNRYLKPWAKLDLICKTNRLELYLQSLKDLSETQLNPLRDAWNLLLIDGKLNAKWVDYDSEKGIINNIKEPTIIKKTKNKVKNKD